MSDYSEKELLMLSNFVYLNVSKQDGTISEILSEYRSSDGSFTEESVRAAGTGGGLDSKQVSELFTVMQEECDKSGSDFGELSAARRLEEEDVRGICYTNKMDENPVVVFRGTGGTKEAWTDNMYGGFETDTRIQKEASDFVKYECAAYENISVTGHSKGGNLSQYVTVMNGDKIASCVSFDGQGMNADFIGQNSENLSKYGGKIKSICAYNDFVNILLTTIAGTVLYVKNSESGVNAHSSFYLLKSNEYDQNGNFISGVSQSPVEKSMKKITDIITGLIGAGDDADNLILGGILGEAVATMVMAGSDEEVKDSLKKAASEAMLAVSLKFDSFFNETGDESMALPSQGVYFDRQGVNALAISLSDNMLLTDKMAKKTEKVMENLDISIASRFYADLALGRMVERMGELSVKMEEMEELLNVACEKYASKEAMIALRMQSQGT